MALHAVLGRFESRKCKQCSSFFFLGRRESGEGGGRCGVTFTCGGGVWWRASPVSRQSRPVMGMSAIWIQAAWRSLMAMQPDSHVGRPTGLPGGGGRGVGG